MFAVSDILIFGSFLVAAGLGSLGLRGEVKDSIEERLRWLASIGRLTPESRERSSTPKTWLFALFMVLLLSGFLCLVSWYLSSSAPAYPVSVAPPSVNPWLLNAGFAGCVIAVFQGTLLGYFITNEKTRLVEDVSAAGAANAGRALNNGIIRGLTWIGEASRWLTGIALASFFEYVWVVSLIGIFRVIYEQGIRIIVPTGWILTGSLFATFAGYGMLVWGFLPFTPMVSDRRMQVGALLLAAPLIWLFLLSVLVVVFPSL